MLYPQLSFFSASFHNFDGIKLFFEYHMREMGFPHSSVSKESSLIAQSVKNLPAMQETRVRFLG